MLQTLKKIAARFLQSEQKPAEVASVKFRYSQLAPSNPWLIKEAVDKKLENIEASDKFKKIVLDTLIEFEETGESSRFFEKCINEHHLIDETWSWPEFDYWFDVFKKEGKWPPGWTDYITRDPDPPPASIQESLGCLTVSEIKVFLKKHALMPKPMPKKRPEWEAAICEKGDWNLLRPTIIEKHAASRNLHLHYRKKDKLNLLFNYCAHSIYHRLDYYRHQDLLNDAVAMKIGRITGLQAKSSNDDLAIEKDFVEKFNNKEISAYPPYFPGCSIRIFTTRTARK